MLGLRTVVLTVSAMCLLSLGAMPARATSPRGCVVIAEASNPARPSIAQAPMPQPPTIREHAPENFYTIKARMDAMYAPLRKKLGDRKFFAEEGTGYSAYQEWVYYWWPKVFPSGDFRVARAALSQGRRDHVVARSQASNGCYGWTELGPFDTPQGTVSQGGTGRANWLEFDPSNSHNVFAGSAKGGLWYSVDNGNTWLSGGTDYLQPNIGAADLAVDPTNGNQWFLATGDGGGMADNNVGENGWNLSTGVYRTLNKGQSWDKIGLDLSSSGIFQISRILLAPNNSNTIFAATSNGLYTSGNAFAQPATAVIWQPVPTGLTAVYDIKYQPNSTATLYASGTSVVRSPDGGVTWTPLPGQPFLGPDVVRIALAVSPANPNYLYVVVVEKGPAPCNSGVNTSRLYRFDANNGAWTDKGPVCNTGSYAGDQDGVHSSRAGSIGVSPANADLIYIGDVRPALCTTGGSSGFCNWVSTAGAIHNDVHEIRFSPDGLTIFAASDGGVFRSTDGGTTWTAQNFGYRTATVLRMSTSATNPALIQSGHFDDGTSLYNNGPWTHVLGGDGLTPLIDHIDPIHMYASTQGSAIWRSDDGGLTFPYYVGLPCGNWFTDYVLNSQTPTTVFGACNDVMRSLTRGGGWTNISNFGVNGAIWKLYTAPSNQDYLYTTLVVGQQQQQYLERTTNANDPTPSNVAWTLLPHPSAQWITGIDVDEADPNKFWIVYGGFWPANQKVYHFDGSQYVDLTANLFNGNLGNMSVNTVVHERGTNRIFIGTDHGVYVADVTAPVWTRVGDGTGAELPNIEVYGLEINYVTNKLRANTYGRGTWEIDLANCLPKVAGPDAVIRDSEQDLGNEPDVETGSVMWDSDDIWVWNTQDHQFTYGSMPPRFSHEHTGENPEYNVSPANTPYVYAMVTNRGLQAVSGHVEFWWANATTGGLWPSQWTQILPTNVSTVTVTNLQPGGKWDVYVQWRNIPNPTLSTGGHFCLVARFVADTLTPDPIFPETSSIWGNAANSNNIAWRNVHIVDLIPGSPGPHNADGGQFYVRNTSAGEAPTQLRFDFDRRGESLLNAVQVEVDLGADLFAKWRRANQPGAGVKVSGPTTIILTEPHARLDLDFGPSEEHVVTVRFRSLQPSGPQHGFKLNVTQAAVGGHDGKGAISVIGGVTFDIRAPTERAIRPSR